MRKSKFSEHHIPWLAELEHAIVSSAGAHGELDAAKARIIGERGGDIGSFPAPPWLQLRVLSLGYLILVFPKEFWARIDNSSNDNLEIALNFSENVLRETDLNLKRLRNAFAHADIKLLENGFSYPYDNTKNSSHTVVSFEEFSIILHKLAAYYKELTPK